MTEPSQLFNTVAPLRNVSALVSLIEQLECREHDTPGMATYYGPSGYGKTTAATFATNQFNCIHVEMKSCWHGKKMCQEILREMGIDALKTVSDMVDQIAKELSCTNRTLLIDEADFLLTNSKLELVRDIYRSSGVAVILIGEERLPQKLQKWERIHNRMLDHVPALPACLHDVDHIARIRCPKLTLDPALKSHLLRASHHSLRRVVTNLLKVKNFAALKGITKIDMATWGKREFPATSAPAPRRNLA